MSITKLEDIITKKDVFIIIENFIKLTKSPVSIQDLDGNLVIGEKNIKSSEEYPIELQGIEIGRVKGNGNTQFLSTFINYLVYSEYEKRNLADVLMNKCIGCQH